MCDSTAVAAQDCETFNPEAKQTPWRFDFSKHKEELSRQFIVARLDDKDLIDGLQAHGVDYRGKIESNWLQNLFLNWIIPFCLLFFIWGFVFRRMGVGMSALNVGKSKAKIFAADPYFIRADDSALDLIFFQPVPKFFVGNFIYIIAGKEHRIDQ